MGVAVVAGVAALLVSRRDRLPPPGPPASGVRALAVLPFENLGSPEDEYFADGVTDELRGKLAAVPGLLVIASTSSNQYKKTTKTPRQIAGELGVQYLLVGKVRWDKQKDGESRVRVSPELVDVTTASTRWQQPFDAVLNDVFAVQTTIATQVAGALAVALGQSEREHLAAKPTSNLAAYEAYLRGNEAMHGFESPAALRRAIDHYERAVALDPGFALAWAPLSRAPHLPLRLQRAERGLSGGGAGRRGTGHHGLPGAGRPGRGTSGPRRGPARRGPHVARGPHGDLVVPLDAPPAAPS